MFGINAPHLHLLLNHLPVVGGMFATLLLIFALLRRNSELKRAALVAWVVVGLVTIATVLTGGPAAREVKGLTGVNRAMIREHSESADFAEILSYAAAAVAIAGLVLAGRRKESIADKTNGHAFEAFRRYKQPPTWTTTLTLILGLIQVAAMVRTANLGGEIRHPEINNDSLSHALRAVPTPSTAPQKDSKDEDD